MVLCSVTKWANYMYQDYKVCQYSNKHNIYMTMGPYSEGMVHVRGH